MDGIGPCVSTCDQLLTSHFASRPANYHEYFNLRHAQLRNVVERIIGVLKHRFWILIVPPKYKMDTQSHIPSTLCCIHNMICHHDPGDLRENDEEEVPAPGEVLVGDIDNQVVVFGSLADGFVTAVQRDMMSLKREEIAQALWQDHTDYLRTGSNS